MSIKASFAKSRQVLLYGLCLALLLFFLKWLQWKFVIIDHSLEIYIGIIAVFFTVLGIWVAQQLSRPKIRTIVVEKEIHVPAPGPFEVNEAELEKLQLSRREREVLELLSKGMSNAEIAQSLFLSLSTVKTHVSNVFVKMDVKSRAQAIEKAKRLKITP